MPTTYTWIGTTDTDWGTATNFSPNGTPTTGDSVILDHNATKNIAGSDESAGGTIAGVTIKDSFNYLVGTAGSPLKVPVTALTIHLPSGGATAGPGSTRINWNLHTVQSNVTIYGGAGTSSETYLQPIRIQGSHASNVMNLIGGTVGIATDASADTAQFATVNVTNGTLVIGSGTTLATLVQYGGSVVMHCAATTVTQNGGTLTTYGSGAITTVTANGTYVPNSTGTITTLNITSSGSVNFMASPASRTVTNCNMYEGASIAADWTKVTLTNGIDLENTSIDKVTISGSRNCTIAFSALD